MLKSIELRQETAKLVHDARAIKDRADAEKRDMNAEEAAQVDGILATVDDHGKRISALEAEEAQDAVEDAAEDAQEQKNQERSRRLDQHLRDLEKPQVRRVAPIGSQGTETRKNREYRDAYSRFLLTGETRDLTLGTGSAGGYFVAPVEMANDFLEAIRKQVFVRDLAKKFVVNGATALRIPKVNTRIADAEWTGEGVCLTPESSFAAGFADLTPTLLAKLARISWSLLTASSNIEGMVKDELSYVFGATEENAFLNGSGTGQPLGVFTASANGVPVSRDVPTGTVGTIKADDFISARYALRPGYAARPTTRWVMSSTIMGQVRMLKDTTGRYIWQAGLDIDHPENILSIPVVESEFAPSAVTSGSYVALLGDFSYYGIADYPGGFGIQRLVERYAECGYIGFLGHKFTGGAPLLAEAFVRLKVA